MFINKSVNLAIAVMSFNLLATGFAKAESFLVDCKVGNGRSSIFVKSVGTKGAFYVQVISGDEMFTSQDKTANKNGIVTFRFDSDLAVNPKADPIPFNFIRKREVAVVMRKAQSNAHKAGTSARCTPYRRTQPEIQ
ncbi:MAG: hypothetical protein FJ190_12135 [Gammaproteobacteria bacterium]|nr:hypothetical protein [Gammaproteobacteria bacterium]